MDAIGLGMIVICVLICATNGIVLFDIIKNGGTTEQQILQAQMKMFRANIEDLAEV